MLRVAAAEMPDRAWRIAVADPQSAARQLVDPIEAANPHDAVRATAGSVWQPCLSNSMATPVAGQPLCQMQCSALKSGVL